MLFSPFLSKGKYYFGVIPIQHCNMPCPNNNYCNDYAILFFSSTLQYSLSMYNVVLDRILCHLRLINMWHKIIDIFHDTWLKISNNLLFNCFLNNLIFLFNFRFEVQCQFQSFYSLSIFALWSSFLVWSWITNIFSLKKLI